MEAGNEVNVKPRDQWRLAFPREEAGTVMKHLVDTWNWAAARPNEHFNFDLKEPDITQSLENKLDARKTEVGLTGLFGCEIRENEYDPDTGKKLKSWRTDILYFSNRNAEPLRLTFEFKKLKNNSTSRKAYYGDDGMMRFVNNKYGREQPVGVMVGILDKPASLSPAGLKQALTKADVASVLKIIPDGTSFLREPSGEFNGLAAFDTHHTRVSGKLLTIVLAHVMLPFSD